MYRIAEQTAVYSFILSCVAFNVSEGDISSTTKSGQIGGNLVRCSGVRASQRSCIIQAKSGERLAPLGSLKQVEESISAHKSVKSVFHPEINSYIRESSTNFGHEDVAKPYEDVPVGSVGASVHSIDTPDQSSHQHP